MMNIIDIEDDEEIVEWGDNSSDGASKSLRSLRDKAAKLLDKILPDIDKGLSDGMSAKEFSEKIRSLAQITQLKGLLSDDERLAQATAEKLLERSDGKVTGDVADKSVTVNVLNVSSDKDKEDLARKMAFLDQMMKNKGIKETDDQNAS